MFKNLSLKSLIFKLLGNFLLLFSIIGISLTIFPILYQEVKYKISQARNIQYKVTENSTKTPLLGSDQGSFGSILQNNEQKILTPIDSNFDIIIPKIGANSKVFANIDPSNENEFLPILQKGIAHAKGSVFPGMNGNIYLFAHSADNFWNIGRYNAVFYLLKDLSIGDDIVVFFENKRHNYKVIKAGIVDPNETYFLTKTQETGKEVLILQTCWPPGTTFKRFVVFAEPVN